MKEDISPTVWEAGKGTRKPNLGGRRAGRQHTRQETRNLGLKAITDKSGPVSIRFEFGTERTGMTLGGMRLIGNYLGSSFGSMPLSLHFCVKCGVTEGGGHGSDWDQFDMRTHHESDRWPSLSIAAFQQHLQRSSWQKAALKEWIWIPDSARTYGLEFIRLSTSFAHSEVNWDAQIAFWNDPKNRARATQNKQNRAKSKVEEMLRLHGLGSNTETGVPYTEDEIMAIVRGGKQRGHIPGVGRLFRSDDKFSQMLTQLKSQPEIGGGSGSGGLGDDEQGDDEDDGEDGEDEDDS
ncbi:hypothetical protein Tco_1439773 [Tanacetum coccineum]